MISFDAKTASGLLKVALSTTVSPLSSTKKPIVPDWFKSILINDGSIFSIACAFGTGAHEGHGKNDGEHKASKILHFSSRKNNFGGF